MLRFLQTTKKQELTVELFEKLLERKEIHAEETDDESPGTADTGNFYRKGGLTVYHLNLLRRKSNMIILFLYLYFTAHFQTKSMRWALLFSSTASVLSN